MQRGVLLVADDGRGQRVEGRQVRDLPRLGVLDHVAVHHARALEEPVLELRLVKRRRQLVLFEVLGEQLARRGHVLLGERADPGQLRLVGELVELERARHGHARREAREADLDELFRVQRAVVVPGLGCRVYAPLWWRRGERGAADRWGTIALSLRSTGQRAMAEKCDSETGRGRWRRNVLQRRAEGDGGEMCFRDGLKAHRHDATGVGSCAPAVYTAWKTPSTFTRRVTSLMSTGARRFARSFLCTHRKLISTDVKLWRHARTVAGIAVINPTSFPDLAARTPTCHSRLKPGGFSACAPRTLLLRAGGAAVLLSSEAPSRSRGGARWSRMVRPCLSPEPTGHAASPAPY